MLAYLQMRKQSVARTGELTGPLRQVEAQLKPVLRDPDFADFDLDRVFAAVVKVAAAVL
jgi:hypothetical protein